MARRTAGTSSPVMPSSPGSRRSASEGMRPYGRDWPTRTGFRRAETQIPAAAILENSAPRSSFAGVQRPRLVAGPGVPIHEGPRAPEPRALAAGMAPGRGGRSASRSPCVPNWGRRDTTRIRWRRHRTDVSRPSTAATTTAAAPAPSSSQRCSRNIVQNELSSDTGAVAASSRTASANVRQSGSSRPAERRLPTSARNSVSSSLFPRPWWTARALRNHRSAGMSCHCSSAVPRRLSGQRPGTHCCLAAAASRRLVS